jgi:hypothetical protein
LDSEATHEAVAPIGVLVLLATLSACGSSGNGGGDDSGGGGNTNQWGVGKWNSTTWGA